MMPNGLVRFLFACLLAWTATGWAQKASWRSYKAADGLPEPACVSVTIAPHGIVLARHLRQPFISELDGYGIRIIPAPTVSINRTYGSPAGQLWTVSPQGLLEYRGGVWTPHPVPEIAAAFGANSVLPTQAVALCPIRQGIVIFLLPDRLMEYNCQNPEHPRTTLLRTATDMRLGRFSALATARDGGLWISTAQGLAKAPGPVRNLKPDSEWHEYLPPPDPQLTNFGECFEQIDGTVTTVAQLSTNRQSVAVHFDGKEWKIETPSPGPIRYSWQDADSLCWAMTPTTLLQWEEGRQDFAETEEVSARTYYDVAVEPGGAFWLATSGGLFRYAPSTWTIPRPVQKYGGFIACLTGDPQGRLWFITDTTLHVLDENRERLYSLSEQDTRALQGARALYALEDGSLLVDAGGQLLKFRPDTGQLRPVPAPFSPARITTLGPLKGGAVYVQIFPSNPSEPRPRLERYDGTRFEPLADPPPDPSLQGEFYTLLAAENGDLWLSSDQDILWYHEKKWHAFPATDKANPEQARRFAEMADGKIWCATEDRIWEFDGRSWSELRRGFNRINDLVRARDGSVWVASNNGLQRFFQGSWVENGVEEGLPSTLVRQLFEDRLGRLWAATTRGLGLYQPKADTDPPQTLVQGLPEADREIPEGGTITLTWRGQDRWNYTPRSRLLYSYRLDQRDWSPFYDANGVSFPDLVAGPHYFEVRAMDRNCNIGKPTHVEFAVVLPWYKETRLVLIAVAASTVALFFAGLAFNRHWRLLRSYSEVEHKVARTHSGTPGRQPQLLQSQKMTALGTLAAGIAHDFNNILSIVKGSAQIIEENLENPQKVRMRVDRIKTVVDQGAGIVKAMLGFSRDSRPGCHPL